MEKTEEYTVEEIENMRARYNRGLTNPMISPIYMRLAKVVLDEWDEQHKISPNVS